MAISTIRFAALLSILFLSLTLLLPLQSAAAAGGIRASRKMALGSSPPACVNRCMSCRPCEATLVVPSHNKGISVKSSRREDDDSYYLLSWKCMCGNKLYQP